MIQPRLLSTILGAALAGLGAAEPVPLGHPDFYPSPERTIGLRGDGNGHFPGASFAGPFWEGTLVELDRTYQDKWGKEKQAKAWDFSDDARRNIVWKTALPSWANSQPIVVGDLVFTTAEPDWLICCDARTGAVRWAERQNVWEIGGIAPAAAATAQRLFDIGREAVPQFSAMMGRSTMTHVMAPERFAEILEPFLDPVLPRIVAALEKADPQYGWGEVAARQAAALQEYLRLLREARDAGTLKEKGLDHAKPRDVGILEKTIQRRIQEIAKLPGTRQPKLDPPWGNLVGFAVPVPVSDGRFVYASFGQGQSVCYTLDGKRVWASYLEQEHDGSRMSHSQSPRLAEGVFVDMHGGTTTITGLDAKTGKQLWEAPTRADREFGKGGGYYVASHAAMPLRDGDGADITWVLVTQRCNVIRIRDGKVLGALPFPYGSSGGPSVAFSGEVVYRAVNGDNVNSPLVAMRLGLDKGELVTEKLWETPKPASPGYQGFVALPGHYLAPSREGGVFVAETGEVGAKGRRDLGGLSNLVIGSTWIWLEEDLNRDPVHSSWGSRRWDGKALAIFHAADLSDPTSPQPLDTRMVIGGSDFPALPTMQELAPELYALPWYGHNSYGKPMFSVHTDNCLYPQGDRLFCRTIGHLYCLGDLAKPWHTPAAAPPEARTGK